MLVELSQFFISSAYAADAAPQPQGGGMSMFLMIAIFVAFMYFGVWRPQRKRLNEQQSLMNGLKTNDEVLTIGGIIGTITKVTDQYIVLTLANNVEIMLQKSAVSAALPKGTIKSIQS